MDVHDCEVRVNEEELEEEYKLLPVKIEDVIEDSSAEKRMDFEFIHVKMEHEPEILMGPSDKDFVELHRNVADPDAGCSWDEQSNVEHSTDDLEEDNWISGSSPVRNDQESGKDCESSTVFSNPNSPNEDVPPEFEKVFVPDVHLATDVSASDEEPDEQITSNEHLSVDQETQPGCSSWSDEEDLTSETGLDSTSINSKGDSHKHKDCYGEGNVHANRNEVRKSSKNLETETMEKHKKFICSYCDYKCSFYSLLYIHMRTHTGEKPFQCAVCAESFSRKGSLISHMKTHTGEKPFLCSNCNKTFSHKSDLTRHMRSHTGEKPFLCMTCNRRFSEKSTLNKHMSTHNGGNSFQCEICSKIFAHRSTLTTHMNIHSSDESIVCKMCSKRFSHKSKLKMHMRTHTGEKPFQCENCSRRFSQKSSLCTHMRTHTGEKPFECTNCTKRFALKCTLINHMRTHTSD